MELTNSFYVILSYLLALLVVVGSFVKPSHPTRKILRKGIIYYGLPILLLLFSFLHPERLYFRELGTIAERLLIFLLFVKPVATIFKSKFFMRAVTYRRESGIASFWFFIFHTGGLIYVLRLTSISNYLVAFMFWGVIAGIGMLILVATSNNASIKYFKKNWKKIQYLSYPVLIATLVHSSLWAQGNLVKVYVVGGFFIVLKVIEYVILKKRNKK